MGTPKQKWTPEEETALRAGVVRYGIGKWKAISKDPEFSGLLRSRSNVALKNKWKNILLSWQSGRSTAVTEPLPVTSWKKPISRLDDVALKAITKLKEPHGSTRTSIALYIEQRYSIPSHFGKLLATNLKCLVENGKLTKVNHRYRLSPIPVSSMDSSNTVINGNKTFMKAQIDNDQDKMRGLIAKEAAKDAAKAVAEAEAAIAEAQAAAREADYAEAEAEAAYCFTEAVRKALNCTKHTANSDLLIIDMKDWS